MLFVALMTNGFLQKGHEVKKYFYRSNQGRRTDINFALLIELLWVQVRKAGFR